MKKRFTLMMMVLCFLMSIPLKMMAEIVTVHFIDENPLSSYDAYVFDASTDKTISEKDHPWPGKRTNYTTKTVNGKKVVTWTIDLLNCTLANARIVFNDGVANSNKKFPSTGGFEVENNGYYNNIGKTTAPSEGGSSETTTTDIYAVSHYNNNGKWEKNDNFIFTSTDKNIYTCTLKDVPANETVYFRIVKNDKEWGPNPGSNLPLKSEYQTIYQVDNSSVSLQIGPSTVQSTYTITYDSKNNRIKCTSTSGSGTGGSTPVDWNTVSENRLKKHVYSQGFYLAGNFFSFSGNEVTYDDAVFKFQQQKNDATIESGKDYEVYKVEIPASLTAHAQVMYVDKFGNTKNIFGPGSAYEISKTCPETDKSNGWFNTTTNVCDPITQENTNYWNFKSRNESSDEYSDGMYNLYIAVDAKTHTVEKWKIVHDSRKRVTYFISDANNATAMPIYDAYEQNCTYFSNKFYGSVNFAEDRSYYVISNIVRGRDDAFVNYTKDTYGTLISDYNKYNYYPTTNKLFLMGNGGRDWENKEPNNAVSPNEKPIKFGADWSGNQIVEFNPTKCNDNNAKTDKHLGFIGEVQFQGSKRVKITSVSMVGDAIPGTLNVDGSWDFTSHAADMIYDDVEQCYTTTIVTTVEEGKKHFRFVGNHGPKINWYEDSKDVASMKAKTPLTDPAAEGHTADANDPNKVNYTQGNENPEVDWNIIWNRPAGRWTVRLYFYTYNVDGKPVTDYYYTISPCRDLELRDCVNIVYKNEDKIRVIKNVGDYKFLRTWSDEKAWKVSQDIDIYVVDELSADKKNNAVTLHLSLLDSKDKSDKYNVIPANTGVILGTKKKAADIEGGAVFHERTSLTSLNTVVVPMYEYNANEETVGTSVTSKLQPLTYARVVPTSEIVDGKVTYNYLFGAGKGKSVGIDCENENDFFMGFWISNGKGNFYSNSCYLSIDKETADILGVGIRNDQFNPVTHAKMVPGVIFDFANVGGTTGINEVVNQSTKLNDGKYYTLSGQQVEKPTAGGIYIHNGRKFVVK